MTAMPPLTLTGYPLINQITLRIFSSARYRKFANIFIPLDAWNRMFRAVGFSTVEITAAFWPFRAIEPIAPHSLPSALRVWEPLDNRLMHVRAARNFSNHIVVAATK